MKGENIAVLFIVVLFVSAFSFVVYNTSTTMRRVEYEQNQMKTMLGDTCIYLGDTTIIIKYSYRGETFSLSNGLIVDKRLILNKKQ